MTTLLGFSRLLSLTANRCLLTKTAPIVVNKPILHPAIRPWQMSIAGHKTKLPWLEQRPDYQVEIPDMTEEEEKLSKNVMKEINDQIATERAGRLFAVIHICGKQFKVTENDLIMLEGGWPPNIGDKLRLEKVMLVGSKDFTLIGRPILSRELVSVDATIIEKSMSHTITRCRFKKRKQYRRITFYRLHRTLLRINSINVHGVLGERKEVEGLDRIY
ncbi:large ribosomal subunit protein bL21m [Prorops nasuta]|uniref:large ribosomal subunit protein bL21m n=1 Tax=Prorops nasuta TaxID=863751 RepID=UPI0034CDADFB